MSSGGSSPEPRCRGRPLWCSSAWWTGRRCRHSEQGIRGLVRRNGRMGRDDDVGDHRLIAPVGVLAPLQSDELGLSRYGCSAGRGVATVSICCALCTSLLNVDALTSCVVRVADAILRTVLEPEDRQEGNRDTTDHDREDHDGDHQLNEGESVLVERGSLKSDPAAHPAADHHQGVSDSPAAVHLGVAALRICWQRRDRSVLSRPARAKTNAAKAVRTRCRFAASPRYCS